ncbi:MAG: ATP-binding protein [Streptosporangiaceae bacterium]
MQARDDFVATAAYQPEPAAAAAARRFVRETLLSWPLPGRAARQDTLIDDAVLLTSELVTNAVVHAGTSVHVTCRLFGGAVEIVVLDGRPAQLIPDLPHAPADPAERTSGRGLQLPSELASAWGVTYARAVKAVWFRIGLPGFAAGAGTDTGGAAAALADDVATRPGMLATTCVTADSVPAWARRNLTKLGYEELLSSTAEAGRAAVAADVAYLLDAGEDGELRVRAVAGAGPARQAAGSAQGSAARALAGAALSLVTVPLVVDGRVTGVLAVAAAEPDRFGEQDAVRLQDLADWSAPALERARLGELEHGRQDRADFLAEASEELSVSLDEAKIAAVGARLAVGHLAKWCAVLIADEDRPMRLVHAAHADASRIKELEWLLECVDPPTDAASDGPVRGRPAGWRWHLELPSGSGRTREAGSRAHALRVHRGRAGRRSRPDGQDRPPLSAAELAADPVWCFPLDVADQTLGLLAIGGPGENWPPREARELASGLARRIGVALDNAGRSAARRVSAVGQEFPRQRVHEVEARQDPPRQERVHEVEARQDPPRQESPGPPSAGQAAADR